MDFLLSFQKSFTLQLYITALRHISVLITKSIRFLLLIFTNSVRNTSLVVVVFKIKNYHQLRYVGKVEQLAPLLVIIKQRPINVKALKKEQY